VGEPKHTTIGNYVLCGELAKGGMATIFIGHAVGSRKPLAIKMMNAHGESPELITMFLDELAVATKVRHENIVEAIEVLSTDHELGLVMEYIEGETLSRLHRTCRERNTTMPIAIAARIVHGSLSGLHVVHEAKDERNKPLEIVHRDVSPQNIVVGVDGIARLLDFGVAKAKVRLQQTRTGQLKGKVAYMAPEQLDTNDVSRSSDIYAMGIVLWEALANKRLFDADTEGQLVRRVLQGTSEPPSSVVAAVPKALDDIVMRALAHEPSARFPTAKDFADALERATPIASTAEVGAWMNTVARQTLDVRARRIAKMFGEVPEAESSSPSLGPPSSSSLPSTGISGPVITSTTADRGRPAEARGGLRSRARTPSPPSEGATHEVTSHSVVSGVKPPGKHVLVIDDSQVILDNTRRVLEAEGYRVTTTTQTVGTAKYLVDCDLALIDYHMPGFNGAAVIESLRAAAASSGKMCLFYLFTSDRDVAKDYAALGFDGSLTGKGDDAALVRGVRAAFRVLSLRAMKK
jgi:serine/threonine protein kinase